MRQGNQIDVRTESGQRTVTVTPGNSVVYTLTDQQARIGAAGGGKGLWNMVRGISIDGLATIVRASGGTTPIYGDQFPRVIKSINLNTPLFGTMIDPNVVNGMVCKEICEYFGRGYNFSGVRRLPIPGTDATYVRPFELYYPFAQEWCEWADHFDMWLGWLADSTLEIFVEDAAQPFGISGITITNVVFQVSLDVVPANELLIPPFVLTRKYDQTAGSGTTGPTLINVGSAGSLQGVEDASRLLTMLYSHNAGGFIGSGTADQLDAITMGWRDQIQSVLPGHFFQRFLNAAKRFRPGLDATGADAVDIVDSTPPYIMPAGPAQTTRLDDVTARYTPLVWPERNALITQLQKVKGNYPLDFTFGAAQSGQMRTYTQELKYFNVDKASEMVAAAGITPEKVVLTAKLGRKNIKPVDPSKLWGLPRQIMGA